MRACLFLTILALPAAAPAQIAAGQWEMTSTVQAVSIPGVPAGLLGVLKGKPIKISHCVTAAEAAKGPQEMLKGDRACTFTRYSMTGGRLDSEMVCRDGGTTTTATASGSYTPTSFQASGRSVTTGAHAATATVATNGRRTGDCK